MNFWPVLVKEFRAQLRGSRAALLITIYVGLLLVALRVFYTSITGRLDFGAPLVSAQIGQALFIGLALAIQLLTVFLAPATTVNAISTEYERRTFDLLLTTPVSPVQLLLGKLLTGVALLLLLLLTALPLLSIVVLFGGVEAVDIGRVLATVLLTAVAGGMLGLFCSTVTRQTYSATLLCYAILVTLLGGSLFVANLWSITNSMQPAPALYVVANPLSALAAALGTARPPEIVTPGTLQPLAILGLLTQGTITAGAQPAVLPVYRATWMLYTGAILLLFWVCLHIVKPRRRWRIGRSDAVMLALAAGYVALVWVSRPWWQAGLGG